MKKIINYLAIVLFCVLLVGCGNSKIKKLEQDIQSYQGGSFLQTNETIQSLKILSENKQKENKHTQYVCDLVTEKDNVSYQREISLDYTSDKQLTSINVAASANWIIKPLGGVTDDQIISVFSKGGETISVGEDYWKVSDGEFHMDSISKHETDLESKTDSVQMKATFDSDVVTMNATIDLEYVFLDEEWTLDSRKVEGTPTITVKEDKKPSYNEESILNAIDGQSIPFGDGANLPIGFSAGKPFVVNKDEITDLKINETKSGTIKGTDQIYSYSCVITKPNVSFNLEGTVSTIYQDGQWSKLKIDESKLTLSDGVSFAGTWQGTFETGTFNRGTCTLVLQDNGDNNYTGTYTYSYYDSSRAGGSYSVSGKLDTNNIFMDLVPGDWVDKPSKTLKSDKVDVRVVFDIDKNQLEGTGHGYNHIVLTKSN